MNLGIPPANAMATSTSVIMEVTVMVFRRYCSSVLITGTFTYRAE